MQTSHLDELADIIARKHQREGRPDDAQRVQLLRDQQRRAEQAGLKRSRVGAEPFDPEEIAPATLHRIEQMFTYKSGLWRGIAWLDFKRNFYQSVQDFGEDVALAQYEEQFHQALDREEPEELPF